MTNRKTIFIRLLCSLLCLLCVLIPAVPAASAQSAERLLTTVVRSRPGKDSTVIGQMTDGSAVTVLQKQGDYYEVDCFGMTGFVAADQLVRDGDQFRVRCSSDSVETRMAEVRELADSLTLRHALLLLAQEQLGDPYVYGGKRPGGFDCSGLTYYLYGEQGLPIHRTASQQLQDGIIVPKESLQIGDLVFFREPYETTAASHVGIYAGENRIIHAGRNGICYADLDESYFYDYYLCARRLVLTPAIAANLTPASGMLKAQEAKKEEMPAPRRMPTVADLRD